MTVIIVIFEQNVIKITVAVTIDTPTPKKINVSINLDKLIMLNGKGFLKSFNETLEVSLEVVIRQ